MNKKRLPKLSALRLMLVFGIGLFFNSANAQDPDTELVTAFTEDQVALGLQAYQMNCANGCHQADQRY